MENNIVKKLFLLPFMDILLLLVTSRANNISKISNTDLTAEKYTEIIKNLKKELSSINDVSWNFKKSNILFWNITRKETWAKIVANL